VSPQAVAALTATLLGLCGCSDALDQNLLILEGKYTPEPEVNEPAETVVEALSSQPEPPPLEAAEPVYEYDRWANEPGYVCQPVVQAG
jgi:hypothetical protein